MNTLNFRPAHLRTAVLLAALTLGGAMATPTWAATAAARGQQDQPVVVQEDILLFDPVPGTVYLNGGIGQTEQQQMRKDAPNWPLRMTFSDKSSDEFVANVKLKVFDQGGHAVLRLRSAGPMTYVQLPQCEYRVTASYKDQLLTRMVHVGPKGVDANFHWLV